jgi:hypothetical protein
MLYNIKNSWIKICIYGKVYYFLFNIKNYPLLSQAMGNKHYERNNNCFIENQVVPLMV